VDDVVRAWAERLHSLEDDTPFVHPAWGHGTVADALRGLAHETVHHELDVRRHADLGQR
jgi:hypothetical protein